MIYMVFPASGITRLSPEWQVKCQTTKEGRAYLVLAGVSEHTQEKYMQEFLNSGLPFNQVVFIGATSAVARATAIRFNHDGSLHVSPKWVPDEVAYAVWHERLKDMELPEHVEMRIIYAMGGPDFDEHQLEYGNRYMLLKTLTD